jgi:ATP-dependent RNA helicase DeaD
MSISKIRNSIISNNLLSRGFTELSDIQNKILDIYENKKDLLVTSQTGSGKTIAYFLSIQDEISLKKVQENSSPNVLIIAPTRELAIQVYEEALWVFKGEDINVITTIGGMDIKKERKNLLTKFSLIIGTPGRINDHLRKNKLTLSNITTVILDEADEILDLGFKEDLNSILSKISKSTRISMFSATLPKKIVELANKYQKKPIKINVDNKLSQHKDISYDAYYLNSRDIENFTFNLIRYYSNKTIIVFCSTRNEVTRFHSRLHNRGVNSVALSGALKQEERFKALQSIKNGSCRVCIATDVASRGIDIIDLDIVIHANLPRNSETLIHRSGRTGRAGKHGLSIILFSPNSIKTYNRIIEHAKIVPKLKKNLSKKIIEDSENAEFLNKISSISKSKIEDKLINELTENYSLSDLAKSLVSLYKSNLTPIEDVENLDFRSKKDYKKDKFNFSKSNDKNSNFKRKKRRRRKK